MDQSDIVPHDLCIVVESGRGVRICENCVAEAAKLIAETKSRADSTISTAT